MGPITNETAEPSLGAYFVRLFKVDADQFQLLAEKPQSDGAANSSIVHTN